MKLILSTSNIMGGSSPIRRDLTQKSNAELISSLRGNFEAHTQSDDDPAVNGDGAEISKTYNYSSWTHMADDGRRELEIPALDFTNSEGLAEEREQYDITAKLFYLPGAPTEDRAIHTRDAVKLVLKELRMPSIDLLIVSFPGIYFDEAEETCPEKLSTRGQVDAPPEPLESQLEAWKALECLRDHDKFVGRLGVSEFGYDRLAALLDAAATGPAVDQINLRDCCSVPRNLMKLAKEHHVDLLVHNDSPNILPRGAVRELLGGDIGILAEPPATATKRKSLDVEDVPTKLADHTSGERLHGEVQPLWVIKYTAVVKDRGVVENKGYFAAAELIE